MMKNKKIKYEKKSCIYATYYNVSYEDKGSIKLWVENNNHSELFLSNLFVSENNRKQGIGNMLLKYSIQAAKRLGFHQFGLKVISGSWMEDWYKRFGFIVDYMFEEDKLMTYLHKNI